MNSVLFLVLSLFGQVTGDCGCGLGEDCCCGPKCQCAQTVGTSDQLAVQRKAAIKKADADAKSWQGWTKKADGWWYPPTQATQPRTLQFQDSESRGRPIFRGGRRGGC